jgi:hypothetical protein
MIVRAYSWAVLSTNIIPEDMVVGKIYWMGLNQASARRYGDWRYVMVDEDFSYIVTVAAAESFRNFENQFLSYALAVSSGTTTFGTALHLLAL